MRNVISAEDHRFKTRRWLLLVLSTTLLKYTKTDASISVTLCCVSFEKYCYSTRAQTARTWRKAHHNTTGRHKAHWVLLLSLHPALHDFTFTSLSAFWCTCRWEVHRLVSVPEPRAILLIKQTLFLIIHQHSPPVASVTLSINHSSLTLVSHLIAQSFYPPICTLPLQASGRSDSQRSHDVYPAAISLWLYIFRFHRKN